MTHEVGLYHYD